MTTPNELAAELGIPPLRLRNWLRMRYRSNKEAHWSRWSLSLKQVVAAIRHFG